MVPNYGDVHVNGCIEPEFWPEHCMEHKSSSFVFAWAGQYGKPILNWGGRSPDVL